MPTPAPRPPVSWRTELAREGAYTAAACVVIALLLSAQQPARLPANLLYSFAIGGLCFAFIDGGRLLAARWLLHRRPDSEAAREGWPGWGWMSGLVLAGVPIGYSGGSALAGSLLGISPALPGTAPWRSYGFLLLMTLAVAAVGTLFFYTRARLQQARAAAQAAQRIAAETQLRLLQSQLEPHMLFNTLANLRVLIGLDAERAQAMLDRLIAFLRATLGASRVERHALAAEFARSADYLALIGIRMGERLRVELDLPEELAALPVPPLLLQPLVENAIKHGLEPKVAGGRLAVRAWRDGDALVLEVQDDGVGLSDAAAATGAERGEHGASDGFGTAQVRERLATLYGPAARLDLQHAPQGGTLARITLPLATDEAA